VNPVEKALRKVDEAQRRFTPTAFVFGVVTKYGDDNGGVLVSNLAYSAFVSTFPLQLADPPQARVPTQRPGRAEPAGAGGSAGSDPGSGGWTQ